jgi:hypothetical protein
MPAHKTFVGKAHWLRLVIRLSASFEEEEIGFVRGKGARGLAHVVDRYELSKSGAREGLSFIIGGRRERVPEIRGRGLASSRSTSAPAPGFQ